MPDVRLVCPQCQSANTWATYVHDPCPQAPTGTTEWEVEAMGPTPDGRPANKPCPAPGCGADTAASKVTCKDCMHEW
jgi:hypothetical protein